MTDAEIAGIMGWRGPGAYTAATLRKIRRIIEQVQAAERSTPAGEVQMPPPGWKLVPIEPTEDMITHGFESWPDPFFSTPEEWDAYEAMTGCQQAAHRARLCWAAMLAAAPSASLETEKEKN